MRGRVFTIYILCCTLWGSTWIAIKLGLEHLPPFYFAAVRMAVAGLLVLPLALRSDLRRLSRADWKGLAAMGVALIGVPYALMFRAQVGLPSGLTAILFATFPIWVSLFAHFLLPGEPLTWARGGAALLGLAGIAVLQGPALGALSWQHAMALPMALGLLAPVISAVSNVWMKRALGHIAPAANLCGQLMVGSTFLVALHLALDRHGVVTWNLQSGLALAYLSVFGTVVTFLSYLWLLPRVPISAVGAIPLLDTLVAVLLGTWIGGEPLTPWIAAGAVLILGGAALANLVTFKAPPPSAPA